MVKIFSKQVRFTTVKKLKLIIVLVLLSINCYADTLSEIRTKVRERIRDNGPSGVQKYSDTVIKNWINEGQINAFRILEQTNESVLTRRYTFDTSTMTNEYTLPTNFIEMKRVYMMYTSTSNRTSYLRLDKTKIDALDRRILSWEDSTADEPREYFLRYTTYSVILGLDVYPNSDYAGTDFLRIDYIPLFDDLSSDTDEPFNGVSFLKPFHSLLVDYAEYKCTGNPKAQSDYVAKLELLRQDLIKNTDQKGRFRPVRR